MEGNGCGLTGILFRNFPRGTEEELQDGRYLGRDSNRATLEYKSEALLLGQTPGSRFLLETLISTHLVKKPATQPYPEPAESSAQLHPVSLRSILTNSSELPELTDAIEFIAPTVQVQRADHVTLLTS
jgi:hypothetical protein